MAVNKLLIAKREKVRRLMNKRYQLNPFAWLQDRFGIGVENFRWTDFDFYNGHKWDGDVDPLYNAWMALAKRQNVGIESATGCSKTFTASLAGLWFLDVFKDSLVVCVGPTSSQLKDNLWSEIGKRQGKFKRFRPTSKYLTTRLRIGSENANDPNNSWQIVTRSGSGSDKEEASGKVQGFHRGHMLFILDETPAIAQSVINAIENTCVGEHNLIFALGNPDHESDPLHKFCMKRSTIHFRVSALDFPNVVKGKEFIHGAVTRKSINQRLEEYGEDSNLYLSRVRGLCPNAGQNSLFDIKGFDECWEKKCKIDDSFPACGVDVANSANGDKGVVAYGNKNYLKKVKTFKCPDANAIATNLIFGEKILKNQNYKNQYKIPSLADYGIKPVNVGVDVVGVGVGTVNEFDRMEYVVTGLSGGQDKTRIPHDEHGKPLYQFASLRSQMYYEFALDIKRRAIFFDIKDNQLKERIKKFLRVIKLDDTKTKLSVTSKKDIISMVGHSPDELDALVYWNWIRKVNPNKREYEGVWDVEKY